VKPQQSRACRGRRPSPPDDQFLSFCDSAAPPCSEPHLQLAFCAFETRVLPPLPSGPRSRAADRGVYVHAPNPRLRRYLSHVMR
jgi:hypothetical protein